MFRDKNTTLLVLLLLLLVELQVLKNSWAHKNLNIENAAENFFLPVPCLLDLYLELKRARSFPHKYIFETSTMFLSVSALIFFLSLKKVRH